ncbi:MAG: DUF4145 domain-containing protein [Sulfurovum sp.]|nr:DUF4145 domain-containing protein [Sulfurovum sp.]MCB4773650.1 DUF4145 domain-containing protein [Sulfurovum sp.]
MIDRNLYKGSFDKNQMNNNWRCPRCNAGILHFKEEKVIKEVDAETIEWEKVVGFGSNYRHWQMNSSFVYTTLLFCSNEECKEKVICSGSSSMELYDRKRDSEGNVEDLYQTYYNPLFFYPAINIFNIPKGVPKEVEENIKVSFSLFFSNPPSAANYIRVALESLLTSLKVKRFNINKKTKRQKITLHARIDLLPDKYEKIRKTCEAIKWLGNEGSHSDSKITIDDVLNGYDMFSTILEELYEEKTKKLTKMVKKINTKKGV